MTEKQKKEIERLIKEITEEAKKVVDDYVKNPSEMSGSITQVAEGSPILKEEDTGKDKNES